VSTHRRHTAPRFARPSARQVVGEANPAATGDDEPLFTGPSSFATARCGLCFSAPGEAIDDGPALYGPCRTTLREGWR
jgi:hypothetical protein